MKNIFDFSTDSYRIFTELGITKTLVDIARDNILRNDVAHYIDHVDSVIRLSYQYANTLVPDATGRVNGFSHWTIKRVVVIAALFHDAGCWIDRDTHEVRAFEIVLGLTGIGRGRGVYYSEADYIGIAILEHRASYQKARSNVMSEIVAAADRGLLTYEETLRRSYLYARFRINLPVEKSIEHAVKHIHEKFGPDGRAYTNLPTFCATQDITKLQSDTLDFTEGRKICLARGKEWETYYSEVIDYVKRKTENQSREK